MPKYCLKLDARCASRASDGACYKKDYCQHQSGIDIKPTDAERLILTYLRAIHAKLDVVQDSLQQTR